jgi:hypothetical protein
MRTPVLSLVASLLVVPAHAFGVPPPVGFSLEGAVFERAGATDLRVTAVTSRWVEGWLEAEARLGFGSADRPGGRATAAVTPAFGLRWGPELGRWRPLLGVEGGVLLPADRQSTRPTSAARAGLQWFARRDLALSFELARRWTAGAGGRIEAVMGFGFYP